MTPSEQSYREIPLSKGMVALVDEDDFLFLSGYKWFASKKGGDLWYAMRHEDRKTMVYMHRQVMGLIKGDRQYVDHINHNTLDNRKSNLRVATANQNHYNRTKQKNNTSGYKGVFYHKGARKFMAQIWADGKPVYLGMRETAEQAYDELYAPAAERLHGEFRR